MAYSADAGSPNLGALDATRIAVKDTMSEDSPDLCAATREYLEKEAIKLRGILDAPMTYRQTWAKREEMAVSLPFFKYLDAISSRKLNSKLAAMCLSRPVVLNALMRLPMDMQEGFVDGGMVDVVTAQDGKPMVTKKKPMDCTSAEIIQVFKGDTTRTIEAQVRKIGRVQQKKKLNELVKAMKARSKPL